MSAAVLQDQVVLITGAGRAPGPALALALAEAGAVVALNDLSPVVLDPIVEQVQGRGGQARAYVADATRGMPLRAMLDDVLEDWGRIDVLINNPRIRPEAGLLDLDEWDWQRTVEMNLNGPFLVMKLAARLMREQGRGVILNVVEEAAAPAAYAASQAGLVALSTAAAQEFIAYNIPVHALCLAPSGSDSAGQDTLTRLAVFLCSPAAGQLPGQVFRTAVPPT